MFDDINLVHLLSSSKPIEIAENLSDEQIRSILPALIWIGFQQCPKNHRLTISAEILQIVSRFHDMDSILDLFEIDFDKLNVEIKHLQRIKQKVSGSAQRNSPAMINQEILGFEQASARDRCRIVAQILFDDIDKDLQLIVNLLDEPNHVRLVGDVLCILVIRLSHSFKFGILISNLLQSKYAYEYIIRLILNIPTLKLTLVEFIIRCSQNDSVRCDILRTFIRLYPVYKLRLLRLCYERNTLLLLILDQIDRSTQNFLLLILTNSKSRLWFKKCQTHDLIRQIMANLFQLYAKQQCSEHFLFKIVIILHVHCNVKYTNDEIRQLLNIILSSQVDLILSLCFLFMIPIVIENNQQTILDWIRPRISKLETDEKFLIIGLFCVTNYNEPLNALISSTFDYPCRIETNQSHPLRDLLIHGIFTNNSLVQRFSTLQITENLNANLTSKHISAYFICYLLSTGLCNKHHVEMNAWIWSQILQSTKPIHPIMLTLINEFISAIVNTRCEWRLTPIDTKIILDYLISTKQQTIEIQMLILLYLLTLNDQLQGNDKIRYKKSIKILLDYLPLPHLVEQLTAKNFDGIAYQLGRLMMEQIPQIFLADHVLHLENDLNIISRHHRDTIDNLLEQLKLTLTNGISRKQADQWRRRWFRLYTYHGQLLTLKTVQILLNNSQLTYEDLCADPHSLLRFSLEFYNYPSIIQIILFIMRELLIASRYHFETINKSRQINQQTDIALMQDMKSKSIQEISDAQEALVIQILLDVLHQYKQTTCLPAYRELQGVICSFIHQMFITNPVLAKLVHFQGYPSDQIKPLIYSVPSMHICLDFIPQMLASNELDTQIFAFELLTDLSSFYPIRTALLVVKLALQVYATLLRVLLKTDRIRFFSRTYRFLTQMSSVFPPLTQNSVYILQQALRACSLSPSNLPQIKWTSDSLNRPRTTDV